MVTQPLTLSLVSTGFERLLLSSRARIQPARRCAEVQGETATLATLAGVAAAAAVGTSVFGWDAFFRGAAEVVKAVVMGEEGNEAGPSASRAF